MNEDSLSPDQRHHEGKRHQSGPHFRQGRAMRMVNGTDPPSRITLPRAPSDPNRFFRKLFGKTFKRRYAEGIQPSLKSALPSSSSGNEHRVRTLPAVRPQPACDITNCYCCNPPSLPITSAPAYDPDPDQISNPKTSPLPDTKIVNEKLVKAKKNVAGLSRIPRNIPSAIDNAGSVPYPIDTFTQILQPLKVFNTAITWIAEIHPYAKVALSIFMSASQMILDQADRDIAVERLLSKVLEVFDFITTEEALARIPSMLEIYGKIARQSQECADFITHYSAISSAWERLGKNIFKETDTMIRNYSEALDNLMQQFRDQVARGGVIILHRMAEDLDFSGMEYAAGVGLDTSKLCFPGTREGILSDIKEWVSSTGEEVPRILWLSGAAGKGKSAIAHTIANWSKEAGGFGACFCFDRTRIADRLQQKIFITIARDLADCDPIMRRRLAHAVHEKKELRHTVDISRQWQELVVGPISQAVAVVAVPVLIIIDALDESGKAESREQILRILSSQTSEVPKNFRILITSRPLQDISDTLLTASHVRHVSMDDISQVSTERDIQRYISLKLADLRNTLDDGHFQTLAEKSDGLFEWARLACEYIKGINTIGRSPMSRFNTVVAKTVVDGAAVKGTPLLDDIYKTILAETMPDDKYEEAIPMFRSVMGQIFASFEPLPMAALTAMRVHFLCENDSDEVDRVVGPLGSLITGTANSQTPIRPLHSSFYDFLTDPLRSDKFFVDSSLVHNDLAFASLRVMEHKLHFNICSLDNSYLPNSDVPNLEKRVKKFIPTDLSYACRYWARHVRAMSFEPSLAKEVEAFFGAERLLFWMEALSLMKVLENSVHSLLSIIDWCSGHAEDMHIGDTAKDTLRFVRAFEATISHSTPHLYLSALPFAPRQSSVFRNFATKFPRAPQLIAGHVINWPLTEQLLHGRARFRAVAISRDGRCIIGGSTNGIQKWDMETGKALGAPIKAPTSSVWRIAISQDGRRIASANETTIRVWDADTGKALCAPFRGHTDIISSVSISPDGNRIASGSADNTIRLWDVETGEALGAPLQGHTDHVLSVTISMDGKRVVSGSSDKTIRVWHMRTGQALGASLRGHTDAVRSVAISMDGKLIVSGSNDATIRMWNAKTGQAFGAPLRGHTGSVSSVTISMDGKKIVSGSVDLSIRVWDVQFGQILGIPLRGALEPVDCVAIAPDGKHIVSASFEKAIRVWDTGTDSRQSLGAPVLGHTRRVSSVAISTDGKRIVSGSFDKAVQMWDAVSGKALCGPIQGHINAVSSVAISPKGNLIVSGSHDHTVRLWDAVTGQALGTPLEGHTHAVSCVSISKDGKHIVSGSYDKTLLIWDAGTGKVLGAPLQGHNNVILSVAISPDGKRIVSGSSDNTVRFWNAETGDALGAPLKGHNDAVSCVSISGDGKRIVSGSYDKTILVWDADAGNVLGAPLRGHTDMVLSVAISPDGNCIVSGSYDLTIRVWNTETGEALGVPLRGHTAAILSVAISPNGQHIISGSSDRTIRVWDLEFLLNDNQLLEAPAIRFSSNPTHSLCSATASFLHDSRIPGCRAPNGEGWITGPKGELLLRVPTHLHPVTYASNVLVIPHRALQFDLSRFAHGMSWHMCRKQARSPLYR